MLVFAMVCAKGLCRLVTSDPTPDAQPTAGYVSLFPRMLVLLASSVTTGS